MARPIMEYGSIVFDNMPQHLANMLESVQIQAAHICSGSLRGTSGRIVIQETGWPELKQCRYLQKLMMFYKIINNTAPPYLREIFDQVVQLVPCRNLRSQEHYMPIKCSTNRYANSFFPSCVKEWNLLNKTLTSAKSLEDFKCMLVKDKKVFLLTTLVEIGCMVSC